MVGTNRNLNGLLMNWSDYVYIAYDSPTFLRWAVDIKDSRGHQTKARKGGVAGGGSGRLKIQVGDTQEQVSHVVYKLAYGEISTGYIIDHEDGNETNNHPKNLVMKTLADNNRNLKMSITNTSGVTGVCLYRRKGGQDSFKARWFVNGVIKSRTFSCTKYGKDLAFELAVKARQDGIKSAIEQGDAYTERHGI